MVLGDKKRNITVERYPAEQYAQTSTADEASEPYRPKFAQNSRFCRDFLGTNPKIA